MTDFFISYTQTDRPWAEWIAWTLEKADFRVVLQDWDFQPGDNLILRMHQAAQDCERTVILLSRAYQSSHLGSLEWAAALAQQKKLLPIRIEEVEPVGLLKDVVYVDLVALDVGAARTALRPVRKGSGGSRPRNRCFQSIWRSERGFWAPSTQTPPEA